MADNKTESISPTVTKVLDEYIIVLHADEAIDDEAAGRLDALFGKGKIPKFDAIDAALFPPPNGDKP